MGQTVTYSNCCDNQCNVVWLNRQGGWQNYIFTGVKTFEVETGEAKEFVTSELIKKISEIRGSYDGRICTTGPVPKAHVDIIMESLRRSIQAYLLIGDPSDPDNYKEIILNRGKFTKYRSDDKLFDVAIQFYLAKEVTIQTQ